MSPAVVVKKKFEREIKDVERVISEKLAPPATPKPAATEAEVNPEE